MKDKCHRVVPHVKTLGTALNFPSIKASGRFRASRRDVRPTRYWARVTPCGPTLWSSPCAALASANASFVAAALAAKDFGRSGAGAREPRELLWRERPTSPRPAGACLRIFPSKRQPYCGAKWQQPGRQLGGVAARGVRVLVLLLQKLLLLLLLRPSPLLVLRLLLPLLPLPLLRIRLELPLKLPLPFLQLESDSRAPAGLYQVERRPPAAGVGPRGGAARSDRSGTLVSGCRGTSSVPGFGGSAEQRGGTCGSGLRGGAGRSAARPAAGPASAAGGRRRFGTRRQSSPPPPKLAASAALAQTRSSYAPRGSR